MALPPQAAAAPMPADMGMASGAADAPVDVMDEGAESADMPVLFTVMGAPGGPYTLMAGDEPEGEGAMAGDAPTYDTPQALMRGVMEILNPAEGAEDSFGKGFRGEEDLTAMKPDMPPMV